MALKTSYGYTESKGKLEEAIAWVAKKHNVTIEVSTVTGGDYVEIRSGFRLYAMAGTEIAAASSVAHLANLIQTRLGLDNEGVQVARLEFETANKPDESWTDKWMRDNA